MAKEKIFLNQFLRLKESYAICFENYKTKGQGDIKFFDAKGLPIYMAKRNKA